MLHQAVEFDRVPPVLAGPGPLMAWPPVLMHCAHCPWLTRDRDVDRALDRLKAHLAEKHPAPNAAPAET